CCGRAVVGIDMIIGRSLMLLNSSRTMGSVRRRDDNSRGKVQNVLADSSGVHYRAARALEAKRQAQPACAILSSNRSENQPAGLAIRFWRPTGAKTPWS